MRSKMSTGLLRVPFFNIRSFSKAWGIGWIGRRSITVATGISIGYGKYSRNFHMDSKLLSSIKNVN